MGKVPMHMWFRSLLLFWVVALGTTTASLCRADGIDAAILRDDPRLEKPVSVSARSLPLKTMLGRFSTQSGIELTIDERDTASGYPLLVECSAVPVGKMMDALYRLVSIRGGEWVWVRDGKPGAYIYTLSETFAAKNRADNYNRILNGLLTNFVETLRRLAPMSMEERKRHRDELKKAIHLEGDASMASFFDSEVFWDQANFFFSALTPQQQDAVLHGGSASISLKALPPSVYAFYHKDYLFHNSHTVTPDGTEVPVPEPDSVSFSITQPSPAIGSLAPRVDLGGSQSATSWMATGHLEVGVRHALKSAWMLPGDSETDPASQKEIADQKETEADRIARESELRQMADISTQLPPEVAQRILLNYSLPRLSLCLERLAGGASIPVLAMLPQNENARFSNPGGKPVQKLLDRLEGNFKQYFYKWRNGILLVSYPAWFTVSVPVISYSVLSLLHPDDQGQVPLSELAAFMSKINDTQAQWFAEKGSINEMKRLRPCLLFAAKYPKVLEKTGVHVDDATFASLQAATVVPSYVKLPDQREPILRMREEPAANDPEATSVILLEMYSAEKKKWERLSEVRMRLHLNPFTRQPVMSAPKSS